MLSDWNCHWLLRIACRPEHGTGKNRVNTKIVAAVVVVAGAGIINAYMSKKPITSIVIGSYILLLILSLMDMFGGRLSDLASAFAMLAVVFVLLTEVPWQAIINLAQGKKA